MTDGVCSPGPRLPVRHVAFSRLRSNVTAHTQWRDHPPFSTLLRLGSVPSRAAQRCAPIETMRRSGGSSV